MSCGIGCVPQSATPNFGLCGICNLLDEALTPSLDQSMIRKTGFHFSGSCSSLRVSHDEARKPQSMTGNSIIRPELVIAGLDPAIPIIKAVRFPSGMHRRSEATPFFERLWSSPAMTTESDTQAKGGSCA
jgi:hypothetical protein